MHNPFLKFLTDRGFVSREVADQMDETGQYMREPISSIAAHHGLLRPDQIDDILDEQQTCNERFGTIAVRLDFLTEDQIDLLVRFQTFRHCADIAEALVLGNVLTHENAVRELSAFVSGEREVATIVAGD